jgi:sugar-specific transcriptional regulator TrmB
MNKQIIIEKLKTIGLQEDEIKVYLYLLEFGPKTLLEISRETTLNRSKIYRLIDSMKSHNLIETIDEGWGQKLRAAPPANLEILIDKEASELEAKRKELPSILEMLSGLGTNTQTLFEVKHYKGIEGIKQMVWNELKAKEIVVFSRGEFNEMVGKAFAEKVREEAVLRKQRIYEISNDSQNNFTENLNYQSKHYQGKVISEKQLLIMHHIDIYNDTISIYNWHEKPISGIEIINKPLAEMFKQIFQNYWESII